MQLDNYLSLFMISSYASTIVCGALVGGQSLQHILDFAEDNAISQATVDDDLCCIECVFCDGTSYEKTLKSAR
jgi:hypothetical protein